MIQEAKTKTLISCAFTAQLICVFVFADAAGMPPSIWNSTDKQETDCEVKVE